MPYILLILSLFSIPAQASEGAKLLKQDWSFDGPLGSFDHQSLQRGLQVYKEVCSTCHSLKYVAFRHLSDLGYNEAQIKNFASEFDIAGRKGLPTDYFPSPYATEQDAKDANNGTIPPDLSLMAKARIHGPDYIYNLMLGYDQAPALINPNTCEACTKEDGENCKKFELNPGNHFNKAFPQGGCQIAMGQQLIDDKVSYDGGTPKATKEQLAKDVTQFLMWTAEPNLNARKSLGIKVLFFLFFFTLLAYFSYRRVKKKVLGK